MTTTPTFPKEVHGTVEPACVSAPAITGQRKWLYFNEVDPFCLEWLRKLIKAGSLGDGCIDHRSVELVEPADLAEFHEVHLFAGIGLWAKALRLADFPPDLPVWTGSCPCQPYSVAGKLEGEEDAHGGGGGGITFASAITQITLLDLVFSLDSVITAVGMAQHIAVMVIAVMISVGVMVAFVNPICSFVERHPTVKMLALSFLLLIGFTLVGEACGMHIPKGYVYFAMGFSVVVEFLNLKLRKAGRPVDLHGPEQPGT